MGRIARWRLTDRHEPASVADPDLGDAEAVKLSIGVPAVTSEEEPVDDDEDAREDVGPITRRTTGVRIQVPNASSVQRFLYFAGRRQAT
jgi:hypothetical protein